MNLFLQHRPTPLVIAHRGASAHAPENTLASFVLAADQHADGIELDAKLTRDRAIVVMHDPTVDRTADGHGRVSELTLKEIRQLDAGSKFNPKYAGERVPLLAEVFEVVGQRVVINVELANYTSRNDGLEIKVVELIRQLACFDRVMISSFNPLGLRKVKLAEPRIACGLLYSPELPIYLRRAWLAPLVPHLDARHPHYHQVTAQSVRRAHAHGQQVITWTANDAAVINAVAAAGGAWGIGGEPCFCRAANEH